jgi:hypothetical protein
MAANDNQRQRGMMVQPQLLQSIAACVGTTKVLLHLWKACLFAVYTL